MSNYNNYDLLAEAGGEIRAAQDSLTDALERLEAISPDGGELPAVITPTRFEAAYRGLARSLGWGHDYYDQWTPASQASHRKHTRAVLEGAGFQVQEDPR